MLLRSLIFIFIISLGTTAPHTRVETIEQELELLGLKGKGLSSQNNFEKGLKCEACEITLKFPKTLQAIWCLKRHMGDGQHRTKVGWFLNDNNNIRNAKPKGKCKVRILGHY